MVFSRIGERLKMEIKKKPSGGTYQWKCIHCGRTIRAASQPSGSSILPRCSCKDGKHKFKIAGN